MSINLVNDVFKGFPDTAGSGMFTVMLALCDNADDATGYAWPGIDYLAWKSRQSERNVQYCLKALEGDGWIKYTVKTGPSGCNEYWINIPRLRDAAVVREEEFKAERSKKQASRKGRANPFLAEYESGGATIAPPNPQPLHYQPATIAGSPRKIVHPNPQNDASQPAIALHPNHRTKSNQTTPNRFADRPTTETTPSQALPDPKTKPPGRMESVRDAIQAAQRLAVGSVVWAPAASRCLVALLRDYPETDWPITQLLDCVASRFASEIDPAAPPQEWLHELPRYISGPKDRFKLPDPSRKRGAGSTPATAGAEFEKLCLQLDKSREDNGKILAETAESVRDLLRKTIGKDEHYAWIQPLVFAFVNSDGRVVVLSPSIEWDGVQEKYRQKINEALASVGLTGGFEMWFMQGGKWKQERKAA